MLMSCAEMSLSLFLLLTPFAFLLVRCGNINWAKRTKCNICNTNKPGTSEGGVRYGLMVIWIYVFVRCQSRTETY